MVAVELLRHAKVRDLDLLVGREEQVAGLNILMNHTHTVDVLQALDKLDKVPTGGGGEQQYKISSSPHTRSRIQ